MFCGRSAEELPVSLLCVRVLSQGTSCPRARRSGSWSLRQFASPFVCQPIIRQAIHINNQQPCCHQSNAGGWKFSPPSGDCSGSSGNCSTTDDLAKPLTDDIIGLIPACSRFCRIWSSLVRSRLLIIGRIYHCAPLGTSRNGTTENILATIISYDKMMVSRTTMPHHIIEPVRPAGLPARRLTTVQSICQRATHRPLRPTTIRASAARSVRDAC